MLILYNFWLRFSSLFNPKKQLGRFIGLIFAFIFAAFYGILFGFLFSTDEWEEVGLSTRDNFMIGIFAFFFFMTILRGFYPSYQQLGTWVRPFFPLSKFQRYNLKLSADYASAFFIPGTIFVIGFCLMANDTLGWHYILKFIITLLGANIVRRMIQAFIEFKLKKEGGLFAAILLGLAGLVVLQIYFPIYSATPIWADLLTMALIYGSGFVLEEILPVERKLNETVERESSNLYSSLLFRNKKVRSSILVGLLFKAGFLTADTITFSRSGEHLFDSDVLIWIFFSPVIIFNYVFNNTWGYYRNLWLMLDRAPQPAMELRSFYLKLLRIPLLLDFVIAMLYLAFRPDWLLIGSISWISIAVISIVFGFYWSMLKPKLILKTISSRSNTYIWSNLLGMLFVMLLYGMLLTSWLYWLVPVYLIVSVLVFYYSTKEYTELRKNIFQELFKE